MVGRGHIYITAIRKIPSVTLSRRIDTEADIEASRRVAHGRSAPRTRGRHSRPAAATPPAGGWRTCQHRRVPAVSTASANAIWGRLAAADPFTPRPDPGARDPAAGLGLSAPKIRAPGIARSPTAGSTATRFPTCRPTRPMLRCAPSTASGRRRPISTCCSASAIPTLGPPAISPCRRRRGSLSLFRAGPMPRKPLPSPIPGVPGAALLWAYYRAVKQRDPAPLQSAP